MWILLHYNSEYYSEYKEVLYASLVRDKLEARKLELIQDYEKKKKEVRDLNTEAERKLGEYRERVRSFLLRNINCLKDYPVYHIGFDITEWNQVLANKYADYALDIFYEPYKKYMLEQLIDFEKLSEPIPLANTDVFKKTTLQDLDEYTEDNLVIEEVEEI